MTAFARNETTLDQMDITLELRSVNHRYLDISIRAPEEVRDFEQSLRNLLSKKLSRGKVELNIRTQVNASNENGADFQVNANLLSQLSKAAQLIAQQLPNAKDINPLDVLRWPGVIQAQKIDLKELKKSVTLCLESILDDFLDMRKREGDKLAAMLIERCDEMDKTVHEVTKIIPYILETRKQKILTRLADFDVEYEDKRIEQEMVLLAQKMDVTEELDRLGAHLSEVRNVLSQNKPVGRRLDFLMQELNREANTLGSKSVDTATTRASVDLKVLIEQMREQVQNIE